MGGGGSSGVHAMDGQSGDGAREGETLGKGGSHAHRDDSGDDASIAEGSLPSYAPSAASGIEGDPNVDDIDGSLREGRISLGKWGEGGGG